MLIFAHRGASGYAPENTLAAFDLGRRMGANGIETDVRLSRDGVLVLLHDERVDRTTDGRGRVADLTWAELAALDAGAWMGTRFAGQRIVQVAPFLDRYLGRPVLAPAAGEGLPPTEGAEPLTICLEVKAPEAAEPLVALLRERGWTERADLQLSSFVWDVATGLRAACPGLVVGFLTPRFDDDEIEMVAEAGLPQICPRADVLDAGLVARAHARGLQVRAWGVATRDDLRRVFETGADGTTLNWPDWADEVRRQLAGRTGPANGPSGGGGACPRS